MNELQFEHEQTQTNKDLFINKTLNCTNAAQPQNATAVDQLKLYITGDTVDYIVCEINKYAEQFIRTNTLKPHSSVQQRMPTNREMWAFLGLSVLMGIMYKPRLNLYWSTDAIFQTDFFPSVMARDRYLLILHFADNATHDPKDPSSDRLWKMRHFTDIV